MDIIVTPMQMIPPNTSVAIQNPEKEITDGSPAGLRMRDAASAFKMFKLNMATISPIAMTARINISPQIPFAEAPIMLTALKAIWKAMEYDSFPVLMTMSARNSPMKNA